VWSIHEHLKETIRGESENEKVEKMVANRIVKKENAKKKGEREKVVGCCRSFSLR